MGLGAAAFTISFLLVAVQHSGASYWAFTFPALAIVVVGTDLQFNVVNVSTRLPQLGPAILLNWHLPDVRRVLLAQVATIYSQLRFSNNHQACSYNRSRRLRGNILKCFQEACDDWLLRARSIRAIRCALLVCHSNELHQPAPRAVPQDQDSGS